MRKKVKEKRKIPFVTILLLIINTSIFFYYGFDLPEEIANKYGLIPFEFLAGVNQENLITYMFFHKNLWHFLFNILTLVSFGIFLERSIGSGKFLLIYFLSGISAGIAHIVFYPTSVIPLIGASGAIFGLIGVIALLEPTLRVYLFFVIPIPIILFVAGYIFLATYLMEIGLTFGVSHIAHIGGMFCGAFLAFFISFKKAVKGLGYGILTYILLIGIIYLVPNFLPSVTQLIKQPKVSHSFEISTYQSNTTHKLFLVNVSVVNKGFDTARNVRISTSFKDLSGKIVAMERSEVFDLKPSFMYTISFGLIVPRNKTVMFYTVIWGGNFPAQESHSNWIKT